MHCWKKWLERLLSLGLCLLWLGVAQAGSITPKSAQLVPDEQGYAVTADFAIQLGSRLEDAVNRGVPLSFRFEVQIKRKRWYWIDEHLAGRVVAYRLSYQALTRQYRLAVGGLHQNFASLGEALQVLGHVAGLHVAEHAALPEGVPVTVAVRLSLDHTQLPKPLQVDALADRDWQVEAGTLRWEHVPTSPSAAAPKEGAADRPPQSDKP